jgi:hypothetical protein
MNAPIPPASNGAHKSAPAFKLSVSRGARVEPPRIVIHGAPGIGKSTLASCASNPVFIDLEHGTLQLDVARIDNVDTWEHLLSAVRVLATEPHDFKTVAIDTLDKAEWLCWKHLCAKYRVDSIEKVGGKNGQSGYGRGYIAAYEEFRLLARELDALRTKRGMTVIVIAHSKIEKAPNALGEEFERWTLKVHKLIAGLFYEGFDAVLYARLEVFTRQSESGKTKGFGDRRVMETQEAPAWLAKNRYRLPVQIPLSWDDLNAGMTRGESEMVTSLLAEITTSLARLEALDTDAAAKARGTLKSTPETAAALSVLLNRINAGVATREAARAASDTASDASPDNTHDTANS